MYLNGMNWKEMQQSTIKNKNGLKLNFILYKITKGNKIKCNKMNWNGIKYK